MKGRARRARERRWLAGAVVLATALAAADAASGEDAVLVGFLAVASIVAAVRLAPRPTGIVAGYTLALAFVLGVPDEIFGEREHLTRVAGVAIVGAVAVWISVVRTRERATRRRLELVADVGEAVQASLDHEVTTIEVARIVASDFADWCFVFGREEDGAIRQLAAVHREPARQPLAWELLMRYPLDPDRREGPARAMRTGEPVLYPRVGDELLEAVAYDEESVELLRRLGIRSAIVAPLVAGGRTLGALAHASAESGRVYGPDDLEVAEEVAGRLASAVDQARLLGRLQGAEEDARASRDEMMAILDAVADGVTVQDATGALVYANPVALASMGFDSLDELLAAPLAEVMGKFELMDEERGPFAAEDLPGRRALAGQRPEPATILFRNRVTGEERWSIVKAAPILDEDGRPRLVVNVIEDVTDQRRAADAQRFLAQTGRVLAESLDYETTLARVARLAVPRIADWCAMDVIDDEGDSVRVAIVHEDPEKVRIVEELDRRHSPGTAGGPVPEIVRAGRAELYAEVGLDLLARSATGPEHLSVLMQLGFRSTIVAPMTARGAPLGAITLSMAESGRRFDEDDLALAEELASRCALAVENARLYRQRSRIARTLQQSLLPPHLPDMPGVEVGARFRAAGAGDEVGGDFYDLIDVGGGRFASVIGDVCGKGVEAAAVTALARYTVRAALMREQSPARVLALLNEALMRDGTSRFCTVLCARFGEGNGGLGLRFSSGGHPLPLVLRADGESCEIGDPGTLLGIVPDPKLFDASTALGPGDAVVLYTDGISEATAPERVMTWEEIARFAGSPRGETAEGIAERVLAGALRESGGRPRDDLAVLVVKVPERS